MGMEEAILGIGIGLVALGMLGGQWDDCIGAPFERKKEELIRVATADGEEVARGAECIVRDKLRELEAADKELTECLREETHGAKRLLDKINAYQV